MRRALALGFLTVVAASPLFSELIAIGPAGNGGPSGVYSVLGGGPPVKLFDLGDGTLGFNGGLAYNTANSLLYVIANDGQGNSQLFSLSAAGGGALNLVSSLGQGFRSGLAYDSAEDTMYAISTDNIGFATLNRISSTGVVTPVGPLDYGFYGGLTFRPSDNRLYAFSDVFGAQRALQVINPADAGFSLLFNLGNGDLSFNGGLAFDAADGFYTIGNDWNGVSTLGRFALADGGAFTPISEIGGAFWNAGLAIVPEPVPEPSSWQILAVAVGALSLRLRLRR